MHIICASYQNIGPFENQLITVFLKSGKYLIKAPIGSGKSFLFFDGLVYALYGYSKRDMLNVHMKTGWAKVLFMNDNAEIFLIERSLTGKKGVALYKVTADVETFSLELEKHFEEVVTYGQDFSDFIDRNSLESFDFHTSTEVQQNIELLLPPRSVFLQRHVLMQDSENIFDLQPKTRIDILKLMFNLDAIDTVRDKIAEKKSELRGQYKVLTESSHIVENYKTWYDTLLPLVATIQSLISLCDDPLLQTEFDKVGISQFINDPLSTNADSLKYDVTQWSLTEWTQYLDKLAKEYSVIESEVHALQQSYQQGVSETNTKKEHCDALARKLDAYYKQHGRKDGEAPGEYLQLQLDELLSQRESLLSAIAGLDTSIEHVARQKIAFYGFSYPSKTFIDYLQALDKLKQLGVSKRQELDALEAKIQTLYAQQQNRGQEQEAIKKQLELLKQKEYECVIQAVEHDILVIQKTIADTERSRVELQDQAASLQRSLDSLLVQSERLSTFYCKKIDANCPFVQEINTGAFDKVSGQIEDIQSQITKVETKLQETETILTTQHRLLITKNNDKGSLMYDTFEPSGLEYQTTIARLSSGDNVGSLSGNQVQITVLEKEKEEVERVLGQIRSDYTYLSKANSDLLLIQYQDYNKNLKITNDKLIAGQQQLQSLQQQLQQYYALYAEHRQLANELELLDIKISKTELSLSEKKAALQTPRYLQLPHLQSATKQLEQLVHKASDLHMEKKRTEEKSLETKGQLEIANNLHGIFSKELTLYVLESYIPILNEYINAFLSKVLDLELLIQVSEEGDELHLIINDKYGSREVKSLSGGQKTILRLCWVLATSVVFRNSFLLLDETINNIDSAIIGKVAELLSDYIKQYNITFYTVTHSEQIQQMSIRDKIIELKSLG